MNPVLSRALNVANQARFNAFEHEKRANYGLALDAHEAATETLRVAARSAELAALLDGLAFEAADALAATIDAEHFRNRWNDGPSRRALRRWRLAMWAIGQRPSTLWKASTP